MFNLYASGKRAVTSVASSLEVYTEPQEFPPQDQGSSLVRDKILKSICFELKLGKWWNWTYVTNTLMWSFPKPKSSFGAYEPKSRYVTKLYFETVTRRCIFLIANLNCARSKPTPEREAERQSLKLLWPLTELVYLASWEWEHAVIWVW